MFAGHPCGRGILAAPLDQIGPVQPRRVHPHPDVIGPDLGLGHLADGDDLGTAGSLVDHCAHGLALGYGAMSQELRVHER